MFGGRELVGLERTEIPDTERIIDLARLDHFSLLSWLCKDTRLPYWVKCTSLGLIVYAIGALCTVLSRDFTYFPDYPFLSSSLVLGITLALLARATRETDDAFVQCNKRLDLERGAKHRAKFNEFVSWARAWGPRSRFGEPSSWYYLETLGGALIGLLMGSYWVFYSPGIWWGSTPFRLSSAFFIAWCAFVGYVVGAAIFTTMGLVIILRAYSERFISADRIYVLNPDRMGGLKPFGELLLHLDVALSVPSTAAFMYIAMFQVLAWSVGSWLLLVLYTVVLVVVFFVPILPAHNAMMTAKNASLEKVNALFLEINSAIADRFPKHDRSTVDALRYVYSMYDKASRMSVWPLDLGIAVKLSLTFLYPIMGSLVVAYLTSLIRL